MTNPTVYALHDRIVCAACVPSLLPTMQPGDAIKACRLTADETFECHACSQFIAGDGIVEPAHLTRHLNATTTDDDIIERPCGHGYGPAHGDCPWCEAEIDERHER